MDDNSLAIKLRNEYAQHGILGIFQKLHNRITKSLYYSTCSFWYERNLKDPIDDFMPDINIKTEFLIHDKYRLVEWFKKNKSRFPWIYFEKEISAALKYDHIFLVMQFENNIIGYVKIGRDHCYIHDFDKLIQFEPGNAFIYDTFILPEYRGKNLALFAINQTCQYLREQGFKKIICHIEQWNTPSIKTFGKGGFRTTGTIRFIRLAHVPLFFRGGHLPFFDLEKQLRSH